VDCLEGAYHAMVLDGRKPTEEEIQKDVDAMFHGNFKKWLIH